MGTATSGSYEFTGNLGSKLRIRWNQTIIAATNKSSVGVYLDVANSWASTTYYLTGTIKVNGTTVVTMNSYSPTHRVTTSAGVFTAVQATQYGVAPPWPATNIQHDSLGKKKITISVDMNGFTGNASDYTYGWNATDTREIELGDIPQVSMLVAPTTGELNVPQTLTINRKSSSFTHTITYTCGSKSGTVVENTSATSLSFTPPLGLATENTTGDKVVIRYTLTTISGGQTVGTSTASSQLTIPDSVGPRFLPGWVTVTHYNRNSEAEDIDDYVQGYSRALVTVLESFIDMTGAYGATLKDYALYYDKRREGYYPVSAPYVHLNTYTPFRNAGVNTLTLEVQDSRGRKYTQYLNVTVQPYTNPTISGIEIFRCDETGEKDAAGNYISIQATGNCSSIRGKNSVTLTQKYRAAESAYTTPQELENGVPTVVGEGAISVLSSYEVVLLAVDALGNEATYSEWIPTESVAFHIRRGGDGAAFGKYAEHPKMLDLPPDWVYAIGGIPIGGGGGEGNTTVKIVRWS